MYAEVFTRRVLLFACRVSLVMHTTTSKLHPNLPSTTLTTSIEMVSIVVAACDCVFVDL